MTHAIDVQHFVSTKMDELFLEWLDIPSTQKLIRRLLSLANGGAPSVRVSSPTLSSVSSRGSPTSTAVTLDDEVAMAPLPFFTSLGVSGQPGSPPSSPRPLLSPTGSARSNLPLPRSFPDSASLVSPPRSPSLPTESWVDDSFKLPRSTLVETPSLKPQPAPTVFVASPASKSLDGSSIPEFFVSRKTVIELDSDETAAIDQVFANGPLGDSQELVEFTTTRLGLSKYFADPLFKRIQRLCTGPGSLRIVKGDFVQYWKNRLSLRDPVANFFNIVKQDSNDYITRADFRDFLWVLLDTHPGLAFLRDSPEFQERYADTVICRIFYHTDRKKVNKIYLRDLRRSNNPSIIKSWLDLDATEDINSVRQFFSYEHFYVLYCKFWDLDSDHDFLIDKEDLIKYDGHAWSARGIERVFSQVGMRFTSGIPGKMNYDDFVWFILSDEDKTTEVSLEFFFALVDLDGDGVIRDHEMKYFYEDQVQRLECISQEAPSFTDIMCQMNDLLRPEREGQFRLSEFTKRRKQNAGVFFSILLSLNKFMQYEQRDPFAQKQDQINNPDFTDWDRFCLGEYVRLAMEAGGAQADGAAAGATNHAGADEEYLRNVG